MNVLRLCQSAALLVIAALVLAACSPVQPAQIAPEPVAYDLGEAAIIQERFPVDSRFREMPVRLNGVIAAPTDGGPYPVVLILHGTHPGCPETEHGIDRWPCDPEVEQPNYQGFAWLTSALAAQGYVALAININAENTFGFGEPEPGERLVQIVDLHLDALAEAAAGGDNGFGVELAGRADASKLAIFGHSRGGDAAVALARAWAAAPADENANPISGLLLIAPAVISTAPEGGIPAPMASLISACDGDVVDQSGQLFFEATRLEPEQTEWVTSVWLERANHNHFNAILPRDPFGAPNRPDCDELLDAEAQRAFLADYAADFLTTIFDPDPARVRAALNRMGIDAASLATGELYGQAAQAALLAESRHRLPLLTPASAEEFVNNRVGGVTVAEGVTTFFCPKGYYTPFSHPELADCRRAQVTVPGQPAHGVVNWEGPDGALRFELPAGVNDLLPFDAISVRAVIDPLSPLNPAGAPQSFSIQLKDRSGAIASVIVRPDEPALRYPAGVSEPDHAFGELFSGRLPLMPVRVPISEFQGVDLASIVEAALVFDQTDSGTLFLADVELVRSPRDG